METKANDVQTKMGDHSISGHPNSVNRLDYPMTGDNFVHTLSNRSQETEMMDLSLFRNFAADSSIKHEGSTYHPMESSGGLPFDPAAHLATSMGPFPTDAYAKTTTSLKDDFEFETMLRSVEGGDDHGNVFTGDMSSFNFDLDGDSDGINLKCREHRKRHSTAPCSLFAPSRTGSLAQDFMSTAFSLPPPPVVRARRKSRGKPDSIFLLLKKNGMTDGKTWSRARSCSLRHADQAMFKPSGSALLSPTDKSKSDEAIEKSGLPPITTATSRNSKSRFKPLPLIIPPYVFFNRFQSQLRSPSFSDNNGISMIGVRARTPYTPPPILSPLRRGSGLFCRIRRPSPVAPKSAPVCYSRKESFWENRKHTISRYDKHFFKEKFHINVGTEYQATVPSAPLVEAFLHLASSPAVPGGGINTELALHLLYDCRGDVQKAANRLTASAPLFDHQHPLHDYTYNDCQQWSSKEMIQFEDALLKGDKDFNEVSAAVGVTMRVGTKSVADCIAFYYSWKIVFKRSYHAFRMAKQRREFLQFGRLRSPASSNGVQSVAVITRSRQVRQWKRAVAPTANRTKFIRAISAEGEYDNVFFPQKPPLFFRVFYKIKSRSAHMKIHYRS
ncbi:zinc finger protein [Trichuris trichiura]|uniref:Zinc finger protein n=1 Tax=Trichuris trichiura TaxID=36087 RepID=A0A077Z660_TRITR|nr:zinc finger protein [Trichuris trichiura]